MSLVKSRNPRSGTVYVYESESYWDKEKKQPRNRRRLIGKLDEGTGEIVPTGKKGRPRKQGENTEGMKESGADPLSSLQELDKKERAIRDMEKKIRMLEEENRDLKDSHARLVRNLQELISQQNI